MFCHHKRKVLSMINVPWLQFLTCWTGLFCKPEKVGLRWVSRDLSFLQGVISDDLQLPLWKEYARRLIDESTGPLSTERDETGLDWELSSCGESQKPGKPGNKEHSKERLQDSWRRFCPLILTNFATLFGLNAWQSTEADLSISHSPLCREGSC